MSECPTVKSTHAKTAVTLLLILQIRLSYAFSFASTSMSCRRANTHALPRFLLSTPPSRSMHLFQQLQQYYNTNDQESYNYDDDADDDTQNYAELADQYYANENQGQHYQQQEQSAEYYNNSNHEQQQQMYNEQQQQYNNNEGYYEQQQQQPTLSSLLITGNMQEELQRATSNVDVPLDYLALARQRAMERRVSTNSQAGDTDWLHLANEKKKQQRSSAGEDDDDDDWVASLADEGAVSDLLSVVGVRMDEGTGMMVTESGIVVDMDDNNDDGPRLLL